MLFVIFINDLPDVVPECFSTGHYADDTKPYRNVSSIDDSEKLQDAPTQPYSALFITLNVNPLRFEYHMQSTKLIRAEGEKNLGGDPH
jgi:hypothetical protein